MNLFKGLSCLLVSIPLISFCNCQDSFVSVMQRLEQFEEELFRNKGDMIRMEERIRNIIDAAKTSLRVELKETIRNQVRETMGEIVQEQIVRDTVKMEVVSELLHVKHGYNQIKTEWNHMSKLFRGFQDETDSFHEYVRKKIDLWNGQNTSDACAREKHRLELELQKSKLSISKLKHDNERLRELNKSCQFQISQLKATPSVSVSHGASHHVNSTSPSPVLKTIVKPARPPLSTASVTPARSPVSATSLTTPMPTEKRSRILITQIWSGYNHQFRQLNIQDDSLSVYPYHNLANVYCIAYLAKTREVLIGLYGPYRVLASTLDTSQVRVLSTGIGTYSMAVDEGRDMVFMGTARPKNSISRMSSLGENFTTVIDLSMYENGPKQVTLDTRRKKIYCCTNDRLLVVTYDGQGLTLATGSRMYGVTLDHAVGVLYYNNRKELMRMTVSNNVSTRVSTRMSTRVITLSAVPRNMVLHRGIIYYGGLRTSRLYRANVTHSTGAYNLDSKPVKEFFNTYLCLIP